jgi:hypothetical protein
MPAMSVIRKLIAPACAVAALSISSTAFAGEDPAPEPATAQAEEGEGESSAEEVEATVPVTLETKVAAEAVADGKIRHGGRISLGAIRTIAGLNGITFRYFINDNFHLGVNLGVATFSYRYPDLIDDAVDCTTNEAAAACTKKTRTIAYIGSSLEFIYWVLGKPTGNGIFQANFGVGGRVGFQHLVNSTDVANNLDDPLQLIGEIPLMLQLNIGENFALVPEFGVVFRWNPGTRLNGDPTAMPPEPADSNPGFGDPNGRLPPGEVAGPGFGFELTDHIGIMGGASLLYTF